VECTVFGECSGPAGELDAQHPLLLFEHPHDVDEDIRLFVRVRDPGWSAHISDGP